MVLGLGFRDQGVGLKVECSGFRIEYWKAAGTRSSEAKTHV